MKLFFSLFFLFTISLFALSDSALLKRANANLYSKTKAHVFQAYNDYKTLYLRSVMHEDHDLTVKSLQGIVRSGKKLHIDVSNYQKELQRELEHSYKQPTPKPIKRSKKLAKTKLKYLNKLTKVYWDKRGRLVLRFKKKLNKRDVNFFKLYNGKTNLYRYVFDIHASLQKTQRLSKRGVRSIKMAQYQPDLLRLVIENKSVLKVRFSITSKEMHITIEPTNVKKKSTHKTTHRTVSKTKSKKKTSPTKHLYKKNNKVIVLDPGHGGKDPGAVGYKRYREKMVVLYVARYVRDYLQARGYTVYMTRSNDRFIKLSKRTRYANKKKADLFISIHANASKTKKAKGIETYFLSPSRSNRAKKVAAMENKADVDEMSFYGKQSFLMFMNNHKIIASNKLAIDLQQGMLLELRKHYKGIVDGGVREGPFWVLVGAQMPAVLIEVGFITNPKEAKRLVSKSYQKHIAKGIAEGIERYFMKNR